MISKKLRNGTPVLVVTYSAIGRLIGLALASVSGSLLFFYLRTGSPIKTEDAVVVILFSSGIVVGLALVRARLVVGSRFIEERGLLRRRRVSIPEATIVDWSDRHLVLRGASGEILYRIDPSFNHGKMLEAELREVFKPPSGA